MGMYLYLSGKYLQLSYPVDGFELFLLLSSLVIVLFTLKIIALRLLGFLFDIRHYVREYVAILYLSYLNIALIFLPLLIAFSLTPNEYAGIYGYIAIFILVLIFALQFFRAGANILSNYRFPKVYLIIYLCALEFCPLIILFKALRF
jgi:predicted membrane channel-forming protein YqfA (hemolysin III family)